jgi:hypothetical protein
MIKTAQLKLFSRPGNGCEKILPTPPPTLPTPIRVGTAPELMAGSAAPLPRPPLLDDRCPRMRLADNPDILSTARSHISSILQWPPTRPSGRPPSSLASRPCSTPPLRVYRASLAVTPATVPGGEGSGSGRGQRINQIANRVTFLLIVILSSVIFFWKIDFN